MVKSQVPILSIFLYWVKSQHIRCTQPMAPGHHIEITGEGSVGPPKADELRHTSRSPAHAVCVRGLLVKHSVKKWYQTFASKKMVKRRQKKMAHKYVILKSMEVRIWWAGSWEKSKKDHFFECVQRIKLCDPIHPQLCEVPGLRDDQKSKPGPTFTSFTCGERFKSKCQKVNKSLFKFLFWFLFSGPFRSNIFEPQNHRHQIPRCCKALYANARMPEKNTGCNAPGFLFKISCKTKRRQDWQNRTTLPNNTMGNTAWWWFAKKIYPFSSLVQSSRVLQNLPIRQLRKSRRPRADRVRRCNRRQQQGEACGQCLAGLKNCTELVSI